MAGYFVNQLFFLQILLDLMKTSEVIKAGDRFEWLWKTRFCRVQQKLCDISWSDYWWVGSLNSGFWVTEFWVRLLKYPKLNFFVITEINHELNTKLSIKLSLYIFQNPEVGVPNPSLTRTSTFKVPPSLQVILSKCTVGATQVRRAVQNENIIVILIVFSV